MHCLGTGRMSSNRIGIFTDGNLGGTFIDWSIHWLSGADTYWNWREGPIQLVENPLASSTAHAHKKNHPEGIVETTELLEKAQSVDSLVSFYCMPVQHDSVPGNIKHVDFQKKVRQKRQRDYAQTIKHCLDNSVFTILVDCEPELAAYHAFNRIEAAYLERACPDVESNDRFWYTFFRDDLEKWHRKGLTNIWDRREFMALNIRPFEKPDLFTQTFPNQYVFRFVVSELWYHGSKLMANLLETAGVPIIGDRWRQWQIMYNRWRSFQEPTIIFINQLPRIVDAIVYNQNMPLPEFTLEQEAVIQHCLIYQRKLNLRTWELTKFPNNAQKLHKLLEPNTHLLT